MKGQAEKPATVAAFLAYRYQPCDRFDVTGRGNFSPVNYIDGKTEMSIKPGGAKPPTLAVLRNTPYI